MRAQLLVNAMGGVIGCAGSVVVVFSGQQLNCRLVCAV
jgi:hypothetical protein